MTKNEKKFLTLGEAAEYLGISRGTLYKWIDAGLIVRCELPGHPRFLRETLDKFIESRKS